MNISLFEILGPVMIGPSSSHTAGAARLARVAACIAARPFTRVDYVLHGSFATTGLGHGTDKALLAGALGIAEDDERLRSAYALAKQRGVAYSFTREELADCHENTVRITFTHTDGTCTTVQGASIGGGRICITHINGLQTQIYAEHPTLLLTQHDKPGVVEEVSRLLAANQINIATMRVNRVAKGELATTVIETDGAIPPALAAELTKADNVQSVCIINTSEVPHV